MTDPRHTDPRPKTRGSNVTMWGWIAGIAAVILLAFVLAAGWNDTTDTAGTAPPATTGAGDATIPPATTGSGATENTPAATPDQPATPQTPQPNTGQQ